MSRLVAGILAGILVVGWLATCGGRNALAAEQQPPLPPEQAVRVTREAMDSSWSYPWYDARTDELKRVRLARDWDWDWPDWSLPSMNFSWDWLKIVLWLAVALLLGLVIYVLIRVWRGRGFELQSTPSPDANTQAVDNAARVADLPFTIDPGGGNLLELARRAYAAGDYGRAIVYLYSHELLELDKGQLIRLTRGKTNRQYLRELKGHGRLRTLLESSMQAFEDVFFGGRALARARVEACFGSLDEFTSLARGGVA